MLLHNLFWRFWDRGYTHLQKHEKLVLGGCRIDSIRSKCNSFVWMNWNGTSWNWTYVRMCERWFTFLLRRNHSCRCSKNFSYLNLHGYWCSYSCCFWMDMVQVVNEDPHTSRRTGRTESCQTKGKPMLIYTCFPACLLLSSLSGVKKLRICAFWNFYLQFYDPLWIPEEEESDWIWTWKVGAICHFLKPQKY